MNAAMRKLPDCVDPYVAVACKVFKRIARNTTDYTHDDCTTAARYYDALARFAVENEYRSRPAFEYMRSTVGRRVEDTKAGSIELNIPTRMKNVPPLGPLLGRMKVFFVLRNTRVRPLFASGMVHLLVTSEPSRACAIADIDLMLKNELSTLRIGADEARAPPRRLQPTEEVHGCQMFPSPRLLRTEDIADMLHRHGFTVEACAVRLFLPEEQMVAVVSECMFELWDIPSALLHDLDTARIRTVLALFCHDF